jgi:GTPase
LFERPTSGERALLVHVNFSSRAYQDELDEFQLLATSVGADVIDFICLSRELPTPKYYIGKGQAETIQASIQAQKIELVIFNHNLSPAQERNLEKLWQCRVLGRIGLILAIFAQRAKTHEGKLQVELAQLTHMSTRLVRGWTHLERQKGGIGLRGPGETQLETDRRLLSQRVETIQARLNKVRLSREQNRRKRHRYHIPTISLVGYTNAGKSTLFNRITDSDVYVANQLFATLDPTLRQISIDKFGEIVIADTVGFIRELPHELVDAFKATLEETQIADLLIHVIDASDAAHIYHREQVNLVLSEIGAAHIPQLLVYNKIDRCGISPKIDRDDSGSVRAVWLSAQFSEGLPLLKEAIVEYLSQAFIYKTITLSPAQAHLRAKLYARKVVHDEKIDEDGNFILLIALPPWEYEKILKESEKSIDNDFDV